MLEKMEARRKNANFKIEIVAAPLNHSTIYDLRFTIYDLTM